MKLVRFGAPGEESPGVLDETGTSVIDLSELVGDYDSEFFSTRGVERVAAIVAERNDLSRHLIDGLRLGAPVAKPEKIVCIGLNYADHVAEANFTMPTEPLLFFKAPNTMVGPTDEIRIPKASSRVDWEVELALVIGSRARYLEDPEEAKGVIAGYTVANDLSERGFQLDRGGEWAKGKSCETFNPLGPWLVTPDEAGNVDNLDLWLDVNGVRRQTSSTSNMIWSASYLVWYLSQFMVLEPGDVVDTGTPGGVGNLQVPPIYLGVGDVVTLGVEGLGEQRSVCVNFDD